MKVIAWRQSSTPSTYPKTCTDCIGLFSWGFRAHPTISFVCPAAAFLRLRFRDDDFARQMQQFSDFAEPSFGLHCIFLGSSCTQRTHCLLDFIILRHSNWHLPNARQIRQIQVRIRSWLHWMRMLGDSVVISTNRMRWWLDAKANTSGSSPEISWRSRLWDCCQFTKDALPLEPAFARRTPPSHLHAQHGGLIQWWHVGGDRALMATSYQASNWWDHFWERLNYILHIITYYYIITYYLPQRYCGPTGKKPWTTAGWSTRLCQWRNQNAPSRTCFQCFQPLNLPPTLLLYFFKDRLALGSHTIGDLVMGRPIREAAQLSQTTWLAKLKAVCFFGTCNALYM